MKKLTLHIDGHSVTVPQGATVLEAIQKAGRYVPTLCHDPALKPFGACRLCIVEIDGLRGFPTSCTTPAQEGMTVRTETEDLRRVRRTVVELMVANHPMECLVCDKNQDCELLSVARYVGVEPQSVERLRRGKVNRPLDRSNPAFDFDPE